MMQVACVQMRSGVSIADNISDMEHWVRKAANAGARYVQTPEMTGILQKKRADLFAEIKTQDEDLLVAHCKKLAQELSIWLHIGSHAILVGEQRVANRAFVFSPEGSITASYDKIHMFDVDLDNGESWRESNVYQAGDKAHIVGIDDMKLGISICYDIRFPHLYHQQALAGAMVLSAPSSFTHQTGMAHWHVLQRARAIENGAFMISAAQTGLHADGRKTYGHSLIINPWGEIIAELEEDEPGIICAEIELSEVCKARQKIPNLANKQEFVLSLL